MNLREFVSESIIEILGAINDIQKAAPGTVITSANKIPEFVKLGATEIQVVDFEVMVRADAQAGSQAKLTVVTGFFGGGVGGNSAKTEGHSATLRFKVPISLGYLTSLKERQP
jgi:hypothetical protein